MEEKYLQDKLLTTLEDFQALHDTAANEGFIIDNWLTGSGVSTGDMHFMQVLRLCRGYGWMRMNLQLRKRGN